MTYGGINMLPEDKLREEVKFLTKNMTAIELEKAIKYLISIVGQTMEEALTNPLYDDEYLTEEDKISIAEAEEDVKAERVHSLDDIKRQLGDL
jgi:hypothetical protein